MYLKLTKNNKFERHSPGGCTLSSSLSRSFDQHVTWLSARQTGSWTVQLTWCRRFWHWESFWGL